LWEVDEIKLYFVSNNIKPTVPLLPNTIGAGTKGFE
jgi:hypothetical protein